MRQSWGHHWHELFQVRFRLTFQVHITSHMSCVIPGLEAANHLVGAELPNGWKVTEKLEKDIGDTGGHFSVSYIVQDAKGRRAFMKALNLAKTITFGGDTAKIIQNFINAFEFERATLALCRQKRLRRIAAAIEDGKIHPTGCAYPIFYIIFELAKCDVRKQMRDLKIFELAWLLRTLHHVTSAMNQLHSNGIAHQDLKPSNVLVFDLRETKVGDLGCADQRGNVSPRGGLQIAGDSSYAPPELHYGELSVDWDTRRLGCDLYLLGSLIVFLFTGITMNAVLHKLINSAHKPGIWPHDYRTALPYVRDAFGRAITEIESIIPESVRSEVLVAIKQLCEPDPKLRGHPNNRPGTNQAQNQFGLERYVSLFESLATKAEIGLIKA
jgi:serine/threonine protein kinase